MGRSWPLGIVTVLNGVLMIEGLGPPLLGPGPRLGSPLGLGPQLWEPGPRLGSLLGLGQPAPPPGWVGSGPSVETGQMVVEIAMVRVTTWPGQFLMPGAHEVMVWTVVL